MSRYNQYGNYYDPVGSQSNQQTSYTYRNQNLTSTAEYQNTSNSSAYGSSNYQSYGSNNYRSQQYGASGQQQSNNSSKHAAAALSSLSGRNYDQTSSTNTSSSNNRYDNSNWSSAGASANAYGTSPLAAVPNRTQANNPPLYTNTQSSGTHGRLGTTEQPHSTYQNAPSNAGVRGGSYYNQQQNQPPRYNSPLHAAQAQQHGHRQQVSQGSNNLQSPQLGNAPQSNQHNRQQSASVEPSPTTVDPSQVYDNRAELQRKAQIDAEKRRKYEAEQAARKAEQERLAEEKRKQDEAQKVQEVQEVQEDAAKKADEQKQKNEQRKKVREEKKQSKNAATTLQRMASGPADSGGTDEEAEMRAMFQKMREFNQKNPAMLAKLWDEERSLHEAGKSSPVAASATPAQARKGSASLPTAAAAPAGDLRPFAKPAVPAKGAKQSSAAKKTPQTPATQPPRPSPTQTPTQLWPQHKKGALAEVTTKWLLSLPQNAGKTIQPAQVLSILDANPAYVQLCESLEGLSLQFDRSTLARELLKAVPDGLKAQAVPKAATLVNVVGSATPQANGASATSPASANKKGKQRAQSLANATTPVSATTYEVPMSLSDVAREVNTMGQQPFQPINSYGSPTVQQNEASRYFTHGSALSNGSRPESRSQLPDIKPKIKPEEPPRPPADKEEAARKRTFGDLVDLTMQDSDDDEPPLKKPMLPPNAPVNGVNARHGDPQTYFATPASFQQFMYPGQKKLPPGQSQFYLPGQRPQNQFGGAPQQANGTSQQPAQQRQPEVPAQPTPPPRPKGPTAEQLQTIRMKGKMLVEPIMRDRVARKSNYDSRTIARDVLLATGRHPDMRGLNYHLTPMQKLLGAHGGVYDAGNGSDLATIRWDLIGPEKSKKEDEKVEEADDQLQRELTRDASAAQKRAVKVTASPAPTTLTPGSSARKKRGRPRKSSIVEAKTDGGMTNPGLANAVVSNSLRPAPQTQPPNHLPNMSIPPAGQPLGYASFQQYGPDGKKKKGRPHGWKKSLHSREAQGLAPATQPGRKPGLPGRPKGSGSGITPTTTSGAVGPDYQVYKCEWTGCKSELHNLETLKKHIVKMHGSGADGGGGNNGEYECRWEPCEEMDGNGVPKSFEGIEGWLRHVDERHLGPLAWRKGDGPRAVGVDRSDFYRGTSTSSEPSPLPKYLVDENGRRVTPLISPPEPPTPPPQSTTTTQQPPIASPSNQPPMQPAPAPRGRGRPPKDGIPKHLRPNPTQSGVAGGLDSELRELKEQQRVVGVTMGKMGCVLVDEGRRGCFLDGEGFEDVVRVGEGDEGEG